ncbi:MAG: addiction module protein [Acidobacteriota bacterium]
MNLSQKLQLAEDLWDDIASTLEVVPMHDWQKEELARRKQKLKVTTQEGRDTSSRERLRMSKRRLASSGVLQVPAATS